MVVFQIQRRSPQELLCTGPPQVLDRQSLKTAVDADWGCEASNCQSSLNADSKQRITWNLKGVQSRDADSFQTDRKPLVPKNGYLSVDAFHRQAKKLLRLNFNWRLKDNRDRYYPSKVTVVGLRTSATRDHRTPQISQYCHAVEWLWMFCGIRKESCITKFWKASRLLMATYTVRRSSESIKSLQRMTSFRQRLNLKSSYQMSLSWLRRF